MPFGRAKVVNSISSISYRQGTLGARKVFQIWSRGVSDWERGAFTQAAENLPDPPWALWVTAVSLPCLTHPQHLANECHAHTAPPRPGWLGPRDLRTNRGGWHPPHAVVCPPASKQRWIQAPTELGVPRPDLPERSEGRTQRMALMPPRCIGWGSICTPRLQTTKEFWGPVDGPWPHRWVRACPWRYLI